MVVLIPSLLCSPGTSGKYLWGFLADGLAATGACHHYAEQGQREGHGTCHSNQRVNQGIKSVALSMASHSDPCCYIS